MALAMLVLRLLLLLLPPPLLLPLLWTKSLHHLAFEKVQTCC